MKKPFSLAICTPFYEVKAYAPYIVSLLNSVRLLTETGIKYDYYQITGDSYVDRAKNTLVHRFLQSDHTHLMMIDSDESWDIDGFARIVKAAIYGFEVIGAAYPCKNNWEFYGCIPNRDENGFLMGKEVDGMRLLDMWGIPGGFLVYSRESFERTRPNLKEYREPSTGDMILEAFKCNIEESGGRIGEDIYFQTRYKECGGKVWLEPNVTIQHFGVKAWEGNYHQFLLREKGEVEQETSLGVTADDTKFLLEELAKSDTAMKALDDLEGYDYIGDISK